MHVPYFVPWITNQDKKSVQNALNQRWLTNGPLLEKFEKKVKGIIGTKYAIGVGSATQALHVSVNSLGIGPGDEVIVPTFTFAATANCVSYCGAKPILVDVEADTFNINLKDIKKKISRKTKAIIAVHYGGQSCEMNELKKLAKDHHIHLIEDCAHALGSTYNNKKCGSIGEVGCFSFYPTKVITTGEGGMITTNNKKIYKHSLLLRSQGMDVSPHKREKQAKWRYDVVKLGFNYRLDEIRASLGLSQIERISDANKRRMKIATKYEKLLSKIKGITTPITKLHRNHIFHLYTIKIEKDYHLTRDQLFKKLSRKGIGTSVQYLPLHLMSYNKGKFRNSDFPIANKLKDQVLCLPIFPTMTSKQIEYVVKNISN